MSSTPRYLFVALAVSLAANVFLFGFAAGRFVGAGGPDKPKDMAFIGRPGDLLGASIAMSPTAREAVREAARGRFREIRRDRAEGARRRAKVREVLESDPFDRQQAEEALRALSAFAVAREEARLSLMLDVFEKLPVEERRALLEASEQRRRHRLERRMERRKERGRLEERRAVRDAAPRNVDGAQRTDEETPEDDE